MRMMGGEIEQIVQRERSILYSRTPGAAQDRSVGERCTPDFHSSFAPFLLLRSISQFLPQTKALDYTREVLMKPWKAPVQSNTMNSTMDGPCLGSSQTISTGSPITLRTSTSFVVRWRSGCSSLQNWGWCCKPHTTLSFHRAHTDPRQSLSSTG